MALQIIATATDAAGVTKQITLSFNRPPVNITRPTIR